MKPTELIAAGLCPFCNGSGQVFNVPEQLVLSCRMCDGEGTWDPAKHEGEEPPDVHAIGEVEDA